jgi:hypothetical protein
MMASGQGRIWAGAGLLLASILVYGGVFLYGITFASRPEDMPAWLDRLFPVSMGLGALGLFLIMAGLLRKRSRRK